MTGCHACSLEYSDSEGGEYEECAGFHIIHEDSDDDLDFEEEPQECDARIKGDCIGLDDGEEEEEEEEEEEDEEEDREGVVGEDASTSDDACTTCAVNGDCSQTHTRFA